jgi:hypothetical protein
MLAILTTAAFGQSFVIESSNVLGTTTPPSGAGAPSVVYDAGSGVYTMYFESAITPPPGCSEGWQLKRATSMNGTDFAVDVGWAARPRGEYPCGARHPSAVLHDDGTLAVFFQTLDYTSDDGVAVATNVFGVRETRMLEDLRGLREPTAARLDGEWAVMGVDPSGLVVARSTDLSSFAFDPSPEFAVGVTSFSMDGYEMPALGCVDGTTYPWELYFGGWTGTEKSWSWAVSDVNDAWYVLPTIQTWRDDSAWSGIDFLSDGHNIVVYYETLDTEGLPTIGSARSGGAFDLASLRDRDCQQ